MNKQTAVEWLKLQLETCGDPQYCELTWKELDELCEQAIAMEKEQITHAYVYGSSYGIDLDKGLHPNNYYKEIYKGGEQ